MAKISDLSSLGDLLFGDDPDKLKEVKDNVAKQVQKESTTEGKQHLTVGRSKKGRGGKIVTVVTGFNGNEDALEKLAKELKQKCGVGGSAKDGEILIQGEMREAVAKVLEAMGHKVKISG